MDIRHGNIGSAAIDDRPRSCEPLDIDLQSTAKIPDGVWNSRPHTQSAQLAIIEFKALGLQLKGPGRSPKSEALDNPTGNVITIFAI